jgi:diazepam-binding inhibitor (GABA receptor modulating acyl-CoA-binding protein)
VKKFFFLPFFWFGLVLFPQGLSPKRPCKILVAPARTMGLKEDFDQAAKDALTLPESTTNEDKLILYGLFKVATVGKPETSRPGIFDPKGRAKWDAWKKVEDKSQDEARQEYIVKVTQLKEA